MRKLIATVAIALLFAAPAWAQETGSLSGTVTDPDGAPLPGVAVTIGGTLVPESTVYTQVNGVYRFPVLPPGNDYSLTFALEGFTTVIQEALPVRVGGNTQINVQMDLSSVEETVTVTGQSPIVDVKKSGTGNNVTEEYMQSIPSARDPWVMMQQTAGIQVDRENIGGSESGQQSGFQGNGVNAGDAVWTYDGAEVTDMSALGASPMYYDFDAFEEISISTGGNDPSVATGGIRVNFVTKRGGNTWRGSARFYLTEGDLQSRNVGDPDTGELTGNFTEEELFPGYIGNSINKIQDRGAEIGGPILRDRFFVWGSYGNQDIRQNVGISPDNTQLKNWHAKANFHVGDDLVLNYTFVHANKTKQGRGASATRPPATTWNQGGPSPVHTAKAQYTINDNNYIEGSFNYTGLGFFLEPQGGRDIQTTLDLDSGLWGNTQLFYDTTRPLYNARIDGNSYLAGSSIDHEIKYGYSYRDAETSSISGYPLGVIAVSDAGVPDSARLVQDTLDNFKGNRHSAYVGDTISAGRLTLNVGLRYDHQTSESLPSAVGAHPLAPDQFPAISFDGFDPGFGWDSLSPRLGVTYDLTGDSRTIARLNVGRYYSQMGNFELHRTNTTFGPQMRFEWDDLNGNGFVDLGETADEPFFVSGGFDPDNPSAPSPNQVFETTAPWSNELIVGIERELNRSLAIGGEFIYRKNSNFTWFIREGEDDPAFWTPVTQDISNYGPLDVYEPVGERSVANVYQQREGFSRSYQGVSVFLTKRFADNWMGNMSLTWANPTVDYEPGGYTDPTNIEFLDGGLFTNDNAPSGDAVAGAARWFFKGSGMYALPAGFNVAGFLQVREGNVQRRFVRSNIRENGAGRVNADVANFGTFRYDTFWNLDLRAEKTFDIADKGRIHLIVDAFNVTNNDIILGQFDQVNSANFNRITDVVQGRTIRFGVRAVLR